MAWHRPGVRWPSKHHRFTLLTILNPIWNEHSGLLPTALNGDYLVDASLTAEAKALVGRAGAIVRAKRL